MSQLRVILRDHGIESSPEEPTPNSQTGKRADKSTQAEKKGNQPLILTEDDQSSISDHPDDHLQQVASDQLVEEGEL